MPKKHRRKPITVAPNTYQPTKAETEKVEPPLTHSDGSPASLEQIAKAVLQPVSLLTVENPRQNR